MKFPMVFTTAQREVLTDLRERDDRERREGVRGKLSLKAVATPVAQLLYLLVVQKKAKTIVEFGTSHGYSTLHLAAAAQSTGGHVFTVDAMLEKTAFARENLESAGLQHRVTLATCDGIDFVASLPPNIDFVLVDYGIPQFAPAFDDLREQLAPGCLLFFDGGPQGYWDEEGVREFRTKLEDDPSFLVSVLPMHKEQLIAVRVSGD